MKLLKNEKQWRKWLRDDVGVYADEVRSRQGYATKPPVFPCYGYAVIQSYAYEEQRPVYLMPSDIEAMLGKLIVTI